MGNVDPRDKQAYMNATPMQLEVVRRHLSEVLATLRAQYLSYQTSHWQVVGGSFYGNHLLFERLYKSVQDQVDQLAEKIVGYLGIDGVSLLPQVQDIFRCTTRWSKIGCHHKRGLASEAELQDKIKAAYAAIKNVSAMTLGLDDWLMATANAHESNTYLLQQALTKPPGKKASGHTIADVERFVKRLRTYMDVDDKDQRSLSLATRESGDVGEEVPGKADFDEARRVGRAVVKEFGKDAFSVSMDYADEWVTLEIVLKDGRRANEGPGAKYFFDNPEKKEVAEFAATNAISNDVAVVEEKAPELDIPEKKAIEQAEEAPPLPIEIAKEPGGAAVSTLNRFVIQSEDPVAEKAVKKNRQRMAAWLEQVS